MKEAKGIYILGAGGHAKVTLAALQAAGETVDAVWDDDPARRGEQLLGVEIRGPIAALAAHSGRRAVIAIGDNQARRRLASEFNLDWISVVHPNAWVHESVEIGPGTVIFAGAVVQPDTILGAHVIVNTGASVDHDGRVGDFVHIAPGNAVAGGVSIGEGALLGAGGATVPGARIGAWSIVGAGATVVHEIPPEVVAAGTPARTIRSLRDSDSHPDQEETP